eukprot:RCo019944
MMDGTGPASFPSLRVDNVRSLFSWTDLVKIGAGGTATVYRARCRRARESSRAHSSAPSALVDGQEYAVKVVPKSKLSRDRRLCRGLVHEIVILGVLQSEYIVKLHDAFQDADNVYLVMELAAGTDLFEEIARQKTLTEALAVRITRQLLTAVSYLHRDVHIVHRDLKPENILLDPATMTVKLVDFGSAKFFGAVASTGGDFSPNVLSVAQLQGMMTPCAECPTPMTRTALVSSTPQGTVPYMAPEMLRQINTYGEAPRVTARAELPKLDIFALGVVVYVMLGGCFPFRGHNARAHIRSIDQGVLFPPARFAGISEQAKSFCRLLLEPDRHLRPSAHDALRHPWLLSTTLATVPYAVEPQGVDHEVYREMLQHEEALDEQHDQGFAPSPSAPAERGHGSSAQIRYPVLPDKARSSQARGAPF